MYCDQCGTKNRDQAKFCVKCGIPLNQIQPITTIHQISKQSNTAISITESHTQQSISSETCFLTNDARYEYLKVYPPTCSLANIYSTAFNPILPSKYRYLLWLPYLVMIFLDIDTFRRMNFYLFIGIVAISSFIKDICGTQEIVSNILSEMNNVGKDSRPYFKISTGFVDVKLYEDIMGKSFLSGFSSRIAYMVFKNDEQKQDFCKTLNNKAMFLIKKGFHFEIATPEYEKYANTYGINLQKAGAINYLRLILVKNAKE